MANTLNYTTNISAQVDALGFSANKSVNLGITSSNAIQQSVTIPTSSFTQISLGSLTNVRALWFWNDNVTFTSSVITVSTGSSGGNQLAVLQPGDSAMIPWSGSLNGLYANVINGASGNGITTGIIQYLAVQQ